MERRSRRQGRDRGSRTEEVGRGGAWDGGGGNEGSYGNVEHDQHSRHWHRLKLQALVYDILPSRGKVPESGARSVAPTVLSSLTIPSPQAAWRLSSDVIPPSSVSAIREPFPAAPPRQSSASAG